MDKVIEQLKKLGTIKPREEWVASNKELLLSQIKAQTPTAPSSVFGYWYLLKLLVPVRVLHFAAKPMGVMTLALLLLVSSGAFTVSASRDSLPGDFLYSIKLTSERADVSFSISDDNKTEKHVKNATERVREIETILNDSESGADKAVKVKVASAGLQRSMDSVNDNLEKAKTTKQEKEKAQESIEVVKRVDEQVEELSARLEEQQEKIEADDSLVQTLEEAVGATDETAVKAVEVIIEKYDTGEIDIDPAEVAEAVEKKLKKAEEKLKEVSSLEEELDEPFTLTTISEGAEDSASDETEPAEEDSDAESDASAEEAEEDSEEDSMPATEVAEESLAEAQELLDQGDLSSALDKVKETNEITQQVEDSLAENGEQSVESEETTESEETPSDETDTADSLDEEGTTETEETVEAEQAS